MKNRITNMVGDRICQKHKEFPLVLRQNSLHEKNMKKKIAVRRVGGEGEREEEITDAKGPKGEGWTRT